jgi:hypothetical protein
MNRENLDGFSRSFPHGSSDPGLYHGVCRDEEIRHAGERYKDSDSWSFVKFRLTGIVTPNPL